MARLRRVLWRRVAWLVPGRSDNQRMALEGGLFVARTQDGGETWELLDRVYEFGAGYSDVHVLHAEGGKAYLGALFQRTIYEAGAEGGGYNLALASVSL